MDKPIFKEVPRRIINSFLTDVKLGGLNFHEVALMLHRWGYVSIVPSNQEVINLLYGSMGEYLDHCKQ